MDPNEAHAILVGLVESAWEMERQGLPVSDGLSSFAEHFEALDGWLRKGGVRPDAWS